MINSIPESKNQIESTKKQGCTKEKMLFEGINLISFLNNYTLEN